MRPRSATPQWVTAVGRDNWPLDSDWILELDGHHAQVGRSRLTFDAMTAPLVDGYATGRLAAGLAALGWRAALALDTFTTAHGDIFAYENPFSLLLDRAGDPA